MLATLVNAYTNIGTVLTQYTALYATRTRTPTFSTFSAAASPSSSQPTFFGFPGSPPSGDAITAPETPSKSPSFSPAAVLPQTDPGVCPAARLAVFCRPNGSLTLRMLEARACKAEPKLHHGHTSTQQIQAQNEKQRARSKSSSSLLRLALQLRTQARDKVAEGRANQNRHVCFSVLRN